MPREVVEAAVRSAPSRIELWNIAGDSSSDFSGDNVHFTPGSTAIKMLDEKTHRMRPVSTDDMLRCGKLVEQLDAIDYSATAVVPNDVPKAIGDSIRLYALLKTTSKAIVTGAFTIEGFNVMAEMHLAGLTGVNSVSGPGMHYFQSCMSLEKLVFDAQICDIARRLSEGLEPREDFPADELFDQLLRERTLLTADHTLKYFRQEHCIPGPLIDRTQLENETSAAPDLMQRAHAEVERRLEQYEPPEVLTAEHRRDLEGVMTAAARDFKIGF